MATARTGSSTANSKGNPEIPYERLVGVALNKLRSEILIFLIAYLMLVIGFTVLAPAATQQLRSILYIVPLLGALAYVWQRPRSIAKTVSGPETSIRTAVAGEEAQITGRRGSAAADAGGKVSVSTLFAGKKSKLTGIDAGEQAQPSSESYLVELYRQLDAEAQRRVVKYALDATKQAQKPIP